MPKNKAARCQGRWSCRAPDPTLGSVPALLVLVGGQGGIWGIADLAPSPASRAEAEGRPGAGGWWGWRAGPGGSTEPESAPRWFRLTEGLPAGIQSQQLLGGSLLN